MSNSVVMVGCGNMGGALLAQWAKLDGVTITVIDPAGPQVPDGVDVVASADALSGRAFDALVVAVKPQLIDAAVPQAAGLLKEHGFALSIAAGTSAATISRAVGGRRAIRLMPNMPARIGRGVSGLFAQDGIGPDQKKLADRMGEAVGAAIWVADEDQIDRITAAAGSGPGYVYEFARTYQLAVQELGFDENQSRALVLQTIAGCMALAEATGESFEALRDSIMSKGGTTAAGVSTLNENDVLTKHVKGALQAAYDRACELRAS
ncbi:MAG: pyrroline-5-carboxylate reductase family protein [Oceanicaulis sp.]